MTERRKRHYFWGKAKPSQFDLDFEQTASRMYLEGSQVIIEGEMYDHEDNRLTENSGSFNAEDYRQALQELQTKNEATITNPRNGSTLSLKRDGQTVVLNLSPAVPSGATHSSGATFQTSLAKIQLPE